MQTTPKMLSTYLLNGGLCLYFQRNSQNSKLKRRKMKMENANKFDVQFLDELKISKEKEEEEEVK